MLENEASGSVEPARHEPSADLVAQIPRESLKSLFYLVAGKPDSIHKVLSGGIVVAVGDIMDLHSRISSKLANYDTQGFVASVDIAFQGGTTKSYGSWAEFEAVDWTSAEVTEAVTIKWDFLVMLPRFNFPQRHTLVVRLATMPNPIDLMRLVFDKHPEHIDFSELVAPVSARVDFINALLAEELLNLVKAWKDGLAEPKVYSTLFHKISHRGELLKDALRLSVPFFIAFVACAALARLFEGTDANAPVTVGQYKLAMYWLVASSIALVASERISSWIAGRALKALGNASRTWLFNLTKGDGKHQDKLEAENWSDVKKFLWNAAANILLSVLAAALSTALLP